MIGESLSKAWGRLGCTDTIQAHCLGCLTLVYKELACFRGCFLTRRHNVTQTHGSSSGHAGVGRSDEPEDGSCHTRWRLRDHGKRRSTSAPRTMEERRSTTTSGTMEERWSTATSGTLEVVRRGRDKLDLTRRADQGAMKRMVCPVPSNTASG